MLLILNNLIDFWWSFSKYFSALTFFDYPSTSFWGSLLSYSSYNNNNIVYLAQCNIYKQISNNWK